MQAIDPCGCSCRRIFRTTRFETSPWKAAKQVKVVSHMLEPKVLCHLSRDDVFIELDPSLSHIFVETFLVRLCKVVASWIVSSAQTCSSAVAASESSSRTTSSVLVRARKQHSHTLSTNVSLGGKMGKNVASTSIATSLTAIQCCSRCLLSKSVAVLWSKLAVAHSLAYLMALTMGAFSAWKVSCDGSVQNAPREEANLVFASFLTCRSLSCRVRATAEADLEHHRSPRFPHQMQSSRGIRRDLQRDVSTLRFVTSAIAIWSGRVAPCRTNRCQVLREVRPCARSRVRVDGAGRTSSSTRYRPCC